MVLQQLQQLLGRIYDIPVRHDIHDFLVFDRRQLPALVPRGRARIEEQLLLSQDGEQVRVALFLDRAVLGRLTRSDPMRRLTTANLADYWTVLEGVSHFQYVAWNAGLNRGVTLHELEMQAEVDKYAATLFLLGAQQSGRFPVQLHHWLFERAQVDRSLEPAMIALYASANHYAARFCKALERRFLRRGRLRCEALVRELRQFYRLTHAPKIRHIEAAPTA